ncbi:MAG: hypothetical protein GXO62_01205 [Epsilonproteobacteria bacterium]|nr:hypothetical protein [Campylobacterota bacterium]
MKLFLLIISFFALLNAANNEEILKKLNNIEKNQMLMKQEMKLRFEAIDKRFEMMNESFNKRFEAIDKRFEMMNENFNKRFEAIDKRFEAIDKRFEIITNFIMALTAGIFGLIGFMMWDRRTIIAQAKKEVSDECKIYINELDLKKTDKNFTDNLVKAINELLLKDENAKEVFKKYGIL